MRYYKRTRSRRLFKERSGNLGDMFRERERDGEE